MKVFISWSEERSKLAAELLCEWLPQVIQTIEPWISIDISKGARSTIEISNELEKSKIGIICLTPENLDNKWILFEAGALSKIKKPNVCTFLIDLTPSDIQPPLSQFQHTIFKKEDVFRLLSTINQEISITNEKALSEKTLSQIFEKFWPDFNNTMQKIINLRTEEKKQIRTERDILIEILEIIRQDQNPASFRPQPIPADLITKIDGKFKRLENDFGVHHQEAKRSIINEIKKEFFEDPERKMSIINHIEKYY